MRRSPLGRVVVGGLLAALAVGLVLGSAGCRPRGLTLRQIADALDWRIQFLPAGVFELVVSNPGRAELRLGDVIVRLEAEVGEARPLSGAETLPQAMAAGASVGIEFEFAIGADWPDEFFVRALLSRPGSEPPENELALRETVRPGGIFMTPIWPENGYADFPLDDYLVLRFDPAVSPESLRENLALDPPAPFDIVSSEDPTQPGALDLHPREPLAPFTRYTLTIGAGLEAADGSVTMGRPRCLVFSTGAPSSRSCDLAWSPDGRLLAWTAGSAGGRADLCVGDLGTMTYQVKTSRAAAGAPAWSPDGRYLFFGLWEDRRLALGRLDLTTGSLVSLLAPDQLNDASGLRVLSSPDGLYLAIEANHGGVDAHSDTIQSVLVYNLGSGALTRAPGEGLHSAAVGWSDGSLVYAVTYQNFDQSHRFRYNLYYYDPADGSNEALLSAGELENVGGYCTASAAPVGAFWTWQARSLGRWIVHEPADLWLIWSVGEAPSPPPSRLTYGGQYRQVHLSPDATLAAAAKRRSGSWDIVILDTETGIERAVAEGPAAQFGPAWSPGGDLLAYVEAAGAACRVVVLDPATGSSSPFGPE